MTNNEFPPKLSQITNKELNYWLSRFVLEARNKKGEPYEGGTLYSLCSGVQWYIRAERQSLADRGQLCDLDIFKDTAFTYFRSAFDSVLKELHQQGVGITKKRAEAITEYIEESENVLGDDTPSGYQLCKCIPNTRNLEALSSTTLSSPRVLQACGGNSRTYVRPLQKNLDLSRNLDECVS